MTTPPASQREQGIAAVSAADIRWLRCDLKTTSLLANCLLRQQAIAAAQAHDHIGMRPVFIAPPTF
jgi:D-alanine transaminase